MSGVPVRLAIIGLGLMGGSLAKALARRTDRPFVAAFTADRADAERALAEGAIDRCDGTFGDAVADADVVVLATPVEATLELLAAHAPLLREAGVVVTDVGSVKVPVAWRARTTKLARFVGGHPLCGSERAGWAAARADLYDGATVFIVPGADADADARRMVASLWEAAGAHVEAIDAVEHDRRMAWVSHLPQLVASALAGALAEGGVPVATLGPGGRGMVRLAASQAPLWTGILRHNREEVLPALRALTARLGAFEDALASGDEGRIGELLEDGRRWRERGDA